MTARSMTWAVTLAAFGFAGGVVAVCWVDESVADTEAQLDAMREDIERG